MKNVLTIKGLNEIVDKYDSYILDQWGVMHNGYKGYEDAIQCVNKLLEKNKNIIIISNSSKRKESTLKKLPILGFNPSSFIEVMTSGEMIWQSIKNKKHELTKNLKKNCYYIYDKKKEDGKSYIEGLNNFNFVKDIDEADFILGCSTISDFKTIDYIPILTKALDKKLPFICANPDFETVEKRNSNEIIICMGTVAKLYENFGGEVFILGKPKIDIYLESTKKINKIKKNKILAIGDSIFHDIQGANSFGIDSLLITSGIHQSSFNREKPVWISNINNFKNLNINPTFLCSKFKL